MSLFVEVRPQAADEIEDVVEWIEQASFRHAQAWRIGIARAILSLSEYPRSHAPAPEEEILRADLRQKLYKRHRIIFIVREPRVHVLAVRHQVRRPMLPEQLRERLAEVE